MISVISSCYVYSLESGLHHYSRHPISNLLIHIELGVGTIIEKRGARPHLIYTSRWGWAAWAYNKYRWMGPTRAPTELSIVRRSCMLRWPTLHSAYRILIEGHIYALSRRPTRNQLWYGLERYRDGGVRTINSIYSCARPPTPSICRDLVAIWIMNAPPLIGGECGESRPFVISLIRALT